VVRVRRRLDARLRSRGRRRGSAPARGATQRAVTPGSRAARRGRGNAGLRLRSPEDTTARTHRARRSASSRCASSMAPRLHTHCCGVDACTCARRLSATLGARSDVQASMCRCLSRENAAMQTTRSPRSPALRKPRRACRRAKLSAPRLRAARRARRSAKPQTQSWTATAQMAQAKTTRKT
jgi:hypothetical protein